MLNIEKGPVETMGDAIGEKWKFAWYGPAELR